MSALPFAPASVPVPPSAPAALAAAVVCPSCGQPFVAFASPVVRRGLLASVWAQCPACGAHAQHTRSRFVPVGQPLGGAVGSGQVAAQLPLFG